MIDGPNGREFLRRIAFIPLPSTDNTEISTIVNSHHDENADQGSVVGNLSENISTDLIDSINRGDYVVVEYAANRPIRRFVGL